MGEYRNFPNMPDIDKMGVLTEYDHDHGHPEGWTRAVIEKIKGDMREVYASNGGQYIVLPDNFTNMYPEDEQAAWRFYQEEIVDPEAWARLVEEYEKEELRDEVTWEDYNEKISYVGPKPKTEFKPPYLREYGDGDGKDHQLAVSVDALEHFARQLDEIVGSESDLTLDAQKKLNKIDLKPGGFAKAELLRQCIAGASPKDLGLCGDTVKLLKAVGNALYEIKVSIRALIKEYDSVEDFNKLTVQQLDKVMAGAWTEISGMKNYGQNEYTNAGG